MTQAKNTGKPSAKPSPAKSGKMVAPIAGVRKK